MRLHVLCEGTSEEALLRKFLPRLLSGRHAVQVHPHEGKGELSRDLDRAPEPFRRGLLDQLPAKLRAFNTALDPQTDRIVVLVDLDDSDGGDCSAFLARLQEAVQVCCPQVPVLLRIAIEETEAFYLGDEAAIRRAFGTVKRAPLLTWQPDSICGTWELFQRVIGARSEDKVGWAERMAPELGIQWNGTRANRSPSFCRFCQGVLRIAGETT